MMEYEILKIAGIVVSGILLTGIVKNVKPEFAVYVVIAVIIVIFSIVLDKLLSVFGFLEYVYSDITYGRTLFPILFKVLAISYITDFTAQLARDAGEGAIAEKTELAGKIIIFYISIPILVSILECINSII